MKNIRIFIFPSFGSLRTVKFTSDVYTNNRYHRLCFLTVTIILREFFNILTIADHKLGCPGLVLADSTMECFHFHASKDILWTGSFQS